MRYAAESDAIEALIRVRKSRAASGDDQPHESHLYPCERCDGWHLSSIPFRLDPPDSGRRSNEPIEMYARRLERRIKEQRGQILSMLTIGGTSSNRETRRRIASLTASLAKVTELWQEEKRNREALVERLQRERRWWRR